MASQVDRIYEVLKDGRPHRMEEIHQRVGFCRLNSRIAELRRKRNLNIVCDKTGGTYTYLLLPTPASPSEGADLAGVDRSGVGVPAESSRPTPTSGGLERRSDTPLRGGEANTQERKPVVVRVAPATGDAAKRVSPPLSGVQLTVWSEAAA